MKCSHTFTRQIKAYKIFYTNKPLFEIFVKTILVKNEDPRGIPRGVLEEFFYEELNSSKFIPRGNNFRGVEFLDINSSRNLLKNTRFYQVKFNCSIILYLEF